MINPIQIHESNNAFKYSGIAPQAQAEDISSTVLVLSARFVNNLSRIAVKTTCVVHGAINRLKIEFIMILSIYKNIIYCFRLLGFKIKPSLNWSVIKRFPYIIMDLTTYYLFYKYKNL